MLRHHISGFFVTHFMYVALLLRTEVRGDPALVQKNMVWIPPLEKYGHFLRPLKSFCTSSGQFWGIFYNFFLQRKHSTAWAVQYNYLYLEDKADLCAKTKLFTQCIALLSWTHQATTVGRQAQLFRCPGN